MPSNKTQDKELSDRANELYWRSGRSVNQIAADMDLSKSRLYGLVRPLPSGSPCPQCQAELLFPNRTAMEKGLVSCGECGFEGSTPDELTSKAGPASTATNGRTAAQPPRAAQPAPAAAQPPRAAQPAPAAAQPPRAAQPAPAVAGPDPDNTPAPTGRRLSSKRVLLGSALLGVAAGLYLAIRQRRS